MTTPSADDEPSAPVTRATGAVITALENASVLSGAWQRVT